MEIHCHLFFCFIGNLQPQANVHVFALCEEKTHTGEQTKGPDPEPYCNKNIPSISSEALDLLSNRH